MYDNFNLSQAVDQADGGIRHLYGMIAMYR